MAITVQSIVDQARIRFKDITEAQAVIYLNEIYRDVIFDLRVLVTQENVSLVADQREYVLDQKDVRVWSVAYATSANDNTTLILNPVSSRELDNTTPPWRYMASGQPVDAYVSVNSSGQKVLGLDPKPSVGTSGTYPRLEVMVSKEASSDLTISDSLPEVIRDRSPWVWGIISKHSQLRYPEQFETNYQTYQREYEAMKARIMGVVADVKPQITPWVTQVARPY